MIELALLDSGLRVTEVGNGQSGFLDYNAIAQYHYDGLVNIGNIQKEAWGGALFYEFAVDKSVWLQFAQANNDLAMNLSVADALASTIH